MTCIVYDFKSYRKKSKYKNKPDYSELISRSIFLLFVWVWSSNLMISFYDFKYSHNFDYRSLINYIFQKQTVRSLSCEKDPLRGRTKECIET